MDWSGWHAAEWTFLQRLVGTADGNVVYWTSAARSFQQRAVGQIDPGFVELNDTRTQQHPGYRRCKGYKSEVRLWLVIGMFSMLSSSASGVASAQSGDTGTASDQAPEMVESPPPPTATPQVVYVVVTATPVPTQIPALVTVLFQTRKGTRTEDDLRRELQAAGYAGPWDADAMLAAYDRATAPTATPIPQPATITPTPVPDYSGACFQMASSLSLQATSRIGPLALEGFNPNGLANVCLSYARQDGLAGVQCTQFAIQQEIDFVAIAVQYRLRTYVAAPSIGSLYNGCMGRG